VTDPEALLRIAVDAAAEAGRLLASWRGDERPEVIDTKSSPTDVVTEMDRRSEALITERIRAIRPGDTVLGEEGGQTLGGRDNPAAAAEQAAVRWVVDPLDGTVNYLYGLPHWAVSIAAEVDGTVLAGVVEVPRLGERFTAVAGRGAWLHRNGTATALRCNSGVPLSQALSRPASATTRGAAGSRARSSPPCCRSCGTSGGTDRPPRTCARWRPAGWTRITSGA
jgi:myo-inositol-1(or 4)-monophosphatase